jgi:hypothetical protein
MDRSTACLLALACVSVADARGQEIERQWFGDTANQQFGTTLAWVGDVNADGFIDIGIGAPADSTTFTGAGMLRVVSGADGSVLYTFYGDGKDAGLGNVGHAVGDIDLDGYDDVLVSEPHHGWPSSVGRVFVFSGKDGSILRQIDGSTSLVLDGPVCGTDDIDGDGVPDFAVGSRTREIPIFSGATSAVIRTLQPVNAGTSYFGNGILDPGDIDGDGVSDLFVLQDGCYSGYIKYSSYQPQNFIYCFSGKTGATIWQAANVFHCPFGFHWANALSPTVIGDINGDGVPDIAMGSSTWDPSFGTTGFVTCLSGKDGAQLLFVFQPVFGGKYVWTQFARAVAAAGDVDGDGIPDFAASDTRLSDDPHGDVFFYSGVDGTLLFHVGGTASAAHFGSALVGGIDPDGDGRLDMVIGDDEDATNGGLAGAATLVRFEPLVLDAYYRYRPIQGGSMQITVLGGPPGNPLGLFLVGWNSTPYFNLLALDTFDAHRMSQHWWNVPTGLKGIVVQLQAYAIDGAGHVVASNVENVTFP